MLGKFTCKLTSLPEHNLTHSMTITNKNELMVLGGHSFNQKSPNDKAKMCLIYKADEWRHHSMLNMKRAHSCAITMPDGIYVFGGQIFEPPRSHNSCEFLPNGQLHWNILDTHIPGGIMMSHCVAISPFEILFTGGSGSGKFSRRIMMFDTNTQIWTEKGELIHGRWGHASFRIGSFCAMTQKYAISAMTTKFDNSFCAMSFFL